MTDQQLQQDAENLAGAKTIAKGTGISFFGTLWNRGFLYFFQVTAARFLGDSGYGLFSLGLAIVNLLRVFSLAGLHQGGLRYIARFRALGDPHSEYRLVRTLVAIVLVFGSLIGAVMGLFAGPIAEAYQPGVPEFMVIVLWFSPVIPFASLVMLLSMLSEGQKKIEHGVASRDIIQPFTAFVLGWLLLVFGTGMTGLITGYTISMILGTIVGLILLRKYFLTPIPEAAAESAFSLPTIIGFSIPFLPMMVMQQIGNKLEIYLLGFLGTPQQIGIFSAAAGTATLVTFGLRAVIRIYATLAAELHASGKLAQLEHHLKLATRWSTVLSLPAFLCILLYNTEIMAIFGDNFIDGGDVLVILVFGQVINAATGPVGMTLNMVGYSTLSMFNNLFALLLNIVLDWWLITQYGIIGAAIGSTLALIFINVVMAVEVRHLLKIIPFDILLLRPFTAFIITALLMIPIASLFAPLPIFLRFGFGVGAIGVLFFALYWFLAPEDDREIFRVSFNKGLSYLRQK